MFAALLLMFLPLVGALTFGFDLSCLTLYSLMRSSKSVGAAFGTVWILLGAFVTVIFDFFF